MVLELVGKWSLVTIIEERALCLVSFCPVRLAPWSFGLDGTGDRQRKAFHSMALARGLVDYACALKFKWLF